MSDRKVRGLVVLSAIILLLAGIILFFVFDKQGMGKSKINNYVNYNVSDYVEVSPVVFNDYNDVYNNISVSKINIKNLSYDLTQDFVDKEEEIIGYITGYYNEIKSYSNYSAINTATSTIKTQINGAVLSIMHRIDFNLDENIFSDNIKSYIVTYNIDLGTNKVLSNEEMLSKYNYSKNYIAEKLFNEDIMIEKGQVVIDKETNISLIKSDIERKKGEYIERIIDEFDNIIVMYIDDGSLALIYDNKELRSVFFDNKFATEIKIRNLK